jgi:hypothetical protein
MSTTTKLITRAQIQQYKQLSNSNNNEKLNQIILDSQFIDLRPLLGDRLYNDILAKVAANETTYDDLLNGSTYTYQNITYSNYGLRVVLANYIYARWIMEGDVIDNPFGATIKLDNPHSQTLSINTKKQLNTLNKNTAYNYWLNVQDFLIRTEVELFKNCTRRKNTFKISKISKSW